MRGLNGSVVTKAGVRPVWKIEEACDGEGLAAEPLGPLGFGKIDETGRVPGVCMAHSKTNFV